MPFQHLCLQASVETLVAIGSAMAAGSLTLLAFGLDSLIELASACVLIWRLTVELRRGREFGEAIERLAGRIAGGLLLALAVYVVLSAAWGLWRGEGGEFSLPGLILAGLAIPIMYGLARAKLRVADALASRALRADAIEAVACGWLSAVVVVGLLAELLSGARWIDNVASLGIVWLLVREGREAWTGEQCCDH